MATTRLYVTVFLSLFMHAAFATGVILARGQSIAHATRHLAAPSDLEVAVQQQGRSQREYIEVAPLAVQDSSSFEQPPELASDLGVPRADKPCRSCADTNKKKAVDRPANDEKNTVAFETKRQTNLEKVSKERNRVGSLPPPSTDLAVNATSSSLTQASASATSDVSTEVSPELLRKAMLSSTTNQEVTAVTAGFGSMEMLLRERQLARALTWVFPKIISTDRSFWSAPAKILGSIRFSIGLSKEGRITETRLEAEAGNSNLRDLVMRMTRYLKPGRFEVTTDEQATELIERRFEILVKHQKGQLGEQEEAGNIERIGFEVKTPSQPYRGYIADTHGDEFTMQLRELFQ